MEVIFQILTFFANFAIEMNITGKDVSDMSQEKVDQYKKEKKNRKANIKKEKRRKLMWKIFGPILAILVIALIGASIYFIPQWTNNKAQEAQADEIDYEQLMEMLNQSTDSQSGDSTIETENSGSDSVTEDAATDDASETNTDTLETPDSDETATTTEE